MNKLMIPTILVATVMVAGIFAFMPVQQASTVHTTLGTATNVAVIDANVDLILVDTGTTIPGTITTIDTVVDGIVVDVATVDTVVDGIVLDIVDQDFVLSCSASELLVLSSTGTSGKIFCSVVSAATGIIDFTSLTVTVVEQADDGGAITPGSATEISTTDRFSIDLVDGGANAAGERWCGTVSVTDGTSTAEANVCTSRIT